MFKIRVSKKKNEIVSLQKSCTMKLPTAKIPEASFPTAKMFRRQWHSEAPGTQFGKYGVPYNYD